MSNKPPCERCSGTGLIPHVKRQIDGQPDPWDLQSIELCDLCAGAGVKSPVDAHAANREAAKVATG